MLISIPWHLGLSFCTWISDAEISYGARLGCISFNCTAVHGGRLSDPAAVPSYDAKACGWRYVDGYLMRKALIQRSLHCNWSKAVLLWLVASGPGNRKLRMPTIEGARGCLDIWWFRWWWLCSWHGFADWEACVHKCFEVSLGFFIRSLSPLIYT